MSTMIKSSIRRDGVRRDELTLISASRPAEFLVKVMRGEQFVRAPRDNDAHREVRFPTIQQSMDAANVLLRKLLPDLKAAEVDLTAEVKDTRSFEEKTAAVHELISRLGYVKAPQLIEHALLPQSDLPASSVVSNYTAVDTVPRHPLKSPYGLRSAVQTMCVLTAT